MVLLLAGLLVASLALGHAWAQEGKGKGNDKQDKGNDEKGNRGNGSEDRPGWNRRSSDLPPAALNRALGDSLVVNDTPITSGIFGRAAADSITVEEALPELNAPANIQAAPDITVTSPAPLRISAGQGAEITFDSTAVGTYAVVISRGSSYDSQTLSGQMQVGANSVVWQATDASGAPVPDDRYVYYITAESADGVREPPAAGDGAIMVVTPLSIPASMDMRLMLTVAGSAAAAGAAAMFFARRRRSVTIFVPIEAEAVVDDIKQQHPDAAVANYIDSKTDGVKRYIGVTIPKGADDEWLVEIADKAKQMAEVDSVSLRYRGKMHVL